MGKQKNSAMPNHLDGKHATPTPRNISNSKRTSGAKGKGKMSVASSSKSGGRSY